jgi:hypothetical protein
MGKVLLGRSDEEEEQYGGLFLMLHSRVSENYHLVHISYSLQGRN